MHASEATKLSAAIAAVLMAVSASAQLADEDRVSDDALHGDNALHKEVGEKAADAQQQIDQAVGIVEKMKADPEVAQLLDAAQGIFIVTDYAQAGAIIGGEGGEGVVLLREDLEPGGDWTAPAFYNFGGFTIGAEAGVEVGSMAMLLMTNEAADMFAAEDTEFSLDASAGLTIVDYSERADAAAEGDVVVWADTQGAFAGATVGINGINRDEDEIEAYYGPDVDVREILSGDVSNDRAEDLHEALSG